jgi:predicted NBD/HSP70 family sugar kinase
MLVTIKYLQLNLFTKCTEKGMPVQHLMRAIILAKSITAAEDNGTPAILEIFSKAGNMSGYGTSHLIALLDPSRIIVTGTEPYSAPEKRVHKCYKSFTLRQSVNYRSNEPKSSAQHSVENI